MMDIKVAQRAIESNVDDTHSVFDDVDESILLALDVETYNRQSI